MDIYELFPKSTILEFNQCMNYICDTFNIDKLKINNLVYSFNKFFIITKKIPKLFKHYQNYIF